MGNYLADRTGLIDSSGIRKVFALAAELKDPVNFSIGQPDFDVPESLKDIAIEAIRAGNNKYSQTAGIKALNERIKMLATEQYGWANPKTLVVSGVSGALMLCFMATINPGDEVIMTDPYFVIYKHVVNLLGGKCVFVETYPDFRLDVSRIADAITDKTKIITVNSPANPTGAVYTPQELKDLSEVARKNDVMLMSDEIYEYFSYDGPSESIAKFYEKTLVLKGFSKSHAMTGWRLGYVVADESLAEVIEKMTMIQQYTFVCAPTPFQNAALAAMDYDMTSFVDEYRGKRDMLYDGLADKFEFIKPQGAFYAFIKAPGGNGTEFVQKAIKNNLLIIPGNVFSEKDTHFRISYATTDEKIQQGIEILCSLV
jgi:aspartate aminotransferase/aminotransferase